MYLCQGSAPRWLLLPISLVLQVSLFTATVKSYTPLSDNSLKLIPAPGADFDIKTGSILAPILQTRVPGTPGSLAVQSHFLEFFQNQLPLWKVEYQNSTARTPATGDRDVPFANIIATRDPPWASPGDVGRLALVAHYDSKLTPEGFIGAIDSAAPCAMILHAARSVDSALTRKWSAMEAQGADTGLQEDVGVQILLLDGEEAFINWSATDSLYGSRSLAEEWESTHHHPTSTYRTAISSINLFFLLDLLGSANPSIPSFFATTHWAYKNFATVESRMRALSLLKSNPPHAFLPDHDKAINTFGRGLVEDDHIPFIARGVEILHIIPLPFPGVWHNIKDDGEHLDMPTTSDWAVIVTGFLAEWMDLEGFLEDPVKARDVVEKEAVTSKTEL